MYRLIVPDKTEIEHPRDVARIIRICEARGFLISPTHAQTAWEMYSQSMSAGWLHLPEDDEYVYANIEPYTQVVYED